MLKSKISSAGRQGSSRLHTKRFLGLDLSGAKNQKTTLAAIEYFPNEEKTFLLEIFENIGPEEGSSADEVLLEIIADCEPGISSLCANAPLTLPPCTTCTRKHCPMPKKCTVPAVKWMRQFAQKNLKTKKDSDFKQFTPYTQRPVELWARAKILENLSDNLQFDIDETLGGSKAPLASRYNFLTRHISGIKLIETAPKLSLAILCHTLHIPHRYFKTCRKMEQGVHSRREILSRLTKELDIFIYDRDLEKLSISLSAFDAFVCAYIALMEDQGDTTEAPRGFPSSSGWIHYPTVTF